MKRLPINLKDHQHKEIRRIAHKENKSMSDIVRKAINNYLKEYKAKEGEGS